MARSPRKESREIRAATVERAMVEASRQTGLPPEALDVETLDPGRKGFLGLFGGRPACIRVTFDVRREALERARRFLKGLLARLELDATVLVQEEGELIIDGPDATWIVKEGGALLEALEILARRCTNGAAGRLRLDAAGYRASRGKELDRLAESLLRKARDARGPVRSPQLPSGELKSLRRRLERRGRGSLRIRSVRRRGRQHLVLKERRPEARATVRVPEVESNSAHPESNSAHPRRDSRHRSRTRARKRG